MKRYQVYLNPHSVSILDEVENMSNISRSKLIQGLVDRFAGQVAKVFSKREDKPPKYTHFDKLVGAIKLKGTKPTKKVPFLKNKICLDHDCWLLGINFL